MAFRRNRKGRLRIPLAVRRFYQEQMIRLRFYRVDLQKRITRQKREYQERDPYQNPLFTEFPSELFPEERKSYSEQDSDAKGVRRHFIGGLFRRLLHKPSLANDPADSSGNDPNNAPANGPNDDTANGLTNDPDNNKGNKAGLQILTAIRKLFDGRIIRVPARAPSWILSVATWMLSLLPLQLPSGHAEDQDSSASEMNQASIDRDSSGSCQASSAFEKNDGDPRGWVRGQGEGQNERGQDTSISDNSVALTVAILLLALLLFILPIYCFYTSRQPYPLYILIALAFAVVAFCKIPKGEMRLLRSPLDRAVFILPGLALISSIGAWNIGEAVNLTLLFSCCAALYWAVSSVVNNLAALRRFLAAIIVGTAVAAFLCLTRIFQEGASFHSAEALGAISIIALLFGFYLRNASLNAAGQESTAAHQWDSSANKAMAAFLQGAATEESSTTPWEPASEEITQAYWAGAASNNSYGVFFQNNTAYLSKMAVSHRNEGTRKPAALIQNARAALWKYRTIHQKEWANTALSAAGYLLLLAVIGLGSVLNYIMLSIGILLIMWKFQTDERKKCLAHFLPCATAAFLAAGKVRFCLVWGDITAGWLWVILGLLLVITLECTAVLLTRYLKKTGRRLRPWVRPGAALLLTLLLLYSSTAYLRSSLSPTSQPAYNYAQYYMEEKLLKGLDALSVMTSSPRILLQGTGGGGWEALVCQHQSFYYQEPPPGVFAQAGVEMGLPGLAVLLAVWFLFFKKMLRMLAHRRAGRLLRSFNSHEQKAAHRERTGRSDRRVGRDAPSSHNIDEDAQLKGAALAIFTAAIVIGMYSLVECTISMAALSLFLFTLIGLGKALGRLFISERPDCQGCADSAESPEYFKGLENPEHPERTKSSKCSEDTRSPKNSKNLRRWFRPQSPSVRKKLLQCFAVSGAALLVIAISLNNFAGESYYLKAAQAIKQGDIQTAETNYKEAVHKELFNAEYRKELGKIYLKYGQPIHSVGTARSYSGAQSGSPVTGINSFAPNSCHDTNALYLAREQFKQGIHLARGDAELRTLYASTLLQTGQPEEGVCQLETAVLLRPLQQDLYENLALGYVTAAQMWQRDVSSATSMGRGWHGDVSFATSLSPSPSLLPKPAAGSKTSHMWQRDVLSATGSKTNHSHRKDSLDKTGNRTVPLSAESTSKEKAHLYLRKTMAIPQLLEKRAAQINKRHLRYWSGAPYLGVTPKIQLYCGQAAALLGDKQTACYYLEQAAQDASLKAEAESLLELLD
jgi:tetratricopeptide (TPR) repeat protein